ncbi:MAG: hypothetical protein L3K03_08855 [Thermoplasmata archaeon]|nr:hypothetical protein [Thermoplasmata archaeon]
MPSAAREPRATVPRNTVRNWTAFLVAASFVLVPGMLSHPSNPSTSAVASAASPMPSTPSRLGTPVESVGLAVHNPNSNATGTYQQLVQFDSAAYASWINSNFTNVRAVYTLNETPIEGWIESGASNSSTNTTLWLRLYSIPARGSVGITLQFYPKSAFLLSETGPMGESPLLSSSYAEFDNGWQVFNFYDNFTGTNLSGQWNVNGAWTTHVDNGFQIDSVPANGANITSRASFPYPMVVDFYGDLFQSWPNNTAYDGEGIGENGCSGCGDANIVGWDSTSQSASGPVGYSVYQDTGIWGVPVYSTQRWGIFTTEATGGPYAQFQLNYGDNSSVQDLAYTISPEPITLAASGAPSGALTNTESTDWIRERTYLPVMPTVQPITPLSALLEAFPGTLAVNQSLTLTTVVSGGVPGYTYGYSGLPSGCAAIDAASLSCDPLAAGHFLVTVQVGDGAGQNASATTNVTVTPIGSGPSPLSAQLFVDPLILPVNQSLTLQVIASGGAPPYTYAYSDLPPGCASADVSALSCFPDVPGLYSVESTVTDSAARVAVSWANFTVEAGAHPGPIGVSLIAYPSPVEVSGKLTLLTVTTGGVAPVTYSYAGLPIGCSSANSSILNCFPTTVGRYMVTVTVTDAQGVAGSGTTNVTVEAAPPSATTGNSTGISASEADGIAAAAVIGIVLGAAALVVALSKRRGPSEP